MSIYGTAAAMMAIDASPNRAIVASYISSAVSTSTRSQPAGVVRFTGPATSMTRAPRSAAACASANPIRPLDRFEMKRTGSMGSRVGPAVMRTVCPF